MKPSILRARTFATDGDWMDIPFAACYAGVTIDVLTAALGDGELSASTAYGTGTTARVHSHAVEAWAAERESKLALVG